MKNETLEKYTKIIIETEGENPVTIASVTADTVKLAEGYRARMTPTYD